MKDIARPLKKVLKPILLQLGLYKYVPRFREIRGNLEKRWYRSIKKYTATLNGVTVQFSTEDEYSNDWFFPRYAGGRIHEKTVTGMIVEALRGKHCFVDVGTNLGWFTCLASKIIPNGNIYGFEMDDLNFALLQKNISLNKCNNVECINMAISESSGDLTYKREIDRPDAGFRLEPGEGAGHLAGFVSVKSVTLDDFLEKRGITPEVIKIDVEGAEMNVLRGMRRTLEKTMPVLFLEVHPEQLHNFNTSTSEIINILISNKYNIFEIESMREQVSEAHLRPLSRDSIVERNSMLYASPAGNTTRTLS
jgi:FkbM family methyltransferase